MGYVLEHSDYRLVNYDDHISKPTKPEEIPILNYRYLIKEANLKEKDQIQYIGLIKKLKERSTAYIPAEEIKNFPIKVLQLSIGKLPLSNRTSMDKSLKRAKINTIGDILEYGYGNLLGLERFGKRSHKKLFDAFKFFLGIELEKKIEVKKKEPLPRRGRLTPRRLRMGKMETITFNIKCEKKLSLLAKSILQSAPGKPFYYVREDIDSGLKSTPIERNFLLQYLHSIVISLQNNLSIDFFNIWIVEIYINKIAVYNKFINQEYQNLDPEEYITIRLAYGHRVARKSYDD